MDIKSFVSETLSQILAGIRDAQEGPHGEEIAADGYAVSNTGGTLMNGGTSGIFTTVSFDISLSAETKEGGSTVRVADVQSSDGSSTTAQNLSRVKFAVHVRLPVGGSVRKGRSPSIGKAQTDYDPLT